jgi:hypothetical protein
MKITNELGLPEPLVDAVRNDGYTKGNADFSVTGLIGPPYQRKLMGEYGEKITEDVSERIWSLFGQSVHSIIERSAQDGEGKYQIEQRLYAEVMGKRISGQMDLYDVERKAIQDWKVTSVWSVKDESYKGDWEKQLNIYRYLALKNGMEVTTLEVVAILRDWSRLERMRRGNGYPPHPVVVREIPIWGDEMVEEYIETRVQLHMNPDPPVCTSRDKWEKDTTYAVKKEGAKRAVKVYESLADAEAHIEKHEQVLEGPSEHKLFIETRKGEAVRCLSYCPARSFCNEAGKMMKQDHIPF